GSPRPAAASGRRQPGRPRWRLRPLRTPSILRSGSSCCGRSRPPLRQADAEKNKDRIKSADLIEDLVADATAPWATYNKDKPISERQIAGLLKLYGIKPKTIKLNDGTKDGTTAKGYLSDWFTDVFDRFCTSSSPEEPSPSETPDLFATSPSSPKG